VFFRLAPKDKARIRIQLSAVHSKEHLDKAIEAFVKVGTVLIVIQKKIQAH
jgi:glycine C-acetyltransferase